MPARPRQPQEQEEQAAPNQRRQGRWRGQARQRATRQDNYRLAMAKAARTTAHMQDMYECIRVHVEAMEEAQEQILKLQDKVKKLQARQCLAIADWVEEHGDDVDWNDFDRKIGRNKYMDDIEEDEEASFDSIN